jgi:hypothetical protein
MPSSARNAHVRRAKNKAYNLRRCQSGTSTKAWPVLHDLADMINLKFAEPGSNFPANWNLSGDGHDQGSTSFLPFTVDDVRRELSDDLTCRAGRHGYDDCCLCTRVLLIVGVATLEQVTQHIRFALETLSEAQWAPRIRTSLPTIRALPHLL